MNEVQPHNFTLLIIVYQGLNTGDSHKSGVTAEDLLRCTKSITQATAKAVAAGNSNKQDDIIAASNMGRKAISDMLVICKVIFFSSLVLP